MSKSIQSYWNPLMEQHADQWQQLEGFEGKIRFLTLSIDPQTGEYTRLTEFAAGVDTELLGKQCHDYPEEVLIVRGRLYDAAFDCWLEQGHYASRPPGEQHGPFKTDTGCLVLEISFPGRNQ